MRRPEWLSNAVSIPLKDGAARRKGLALAFGLLLLIINSAIGFYVHTSLSNVSESLPVDMIRQEQDMVQVAQSFSDLMVATEVARNNPTNRNIGTVLDTLVTMQDNMEILRDVHDFDDLAGASALHAIVKPSLSDIDSWLTDGLYDHPPVSPVVLDLVYTRARDTGEDVQNLLLDNHVSAMGLLSVQQDRLSTFRNSLILLLVVVGLLCASGIVGVARYLEHRRNAEAALRRAKEEAEFANRAKSQFLANISHELRTPLNAIIGFAEILKDPDFASNDQEKAVEYAEDIHRSGRHLLSLINDLLDLSKIEAGKVELNEESISLPHALVSTIRLVEHKAYSNNITLNKTLDPEITLIRADDRAMKQILLNLLSNAVKFTEPGGSVDVTVGQTQTGDISISVEDTGIGIDESDISTVLEPFGQVDSGLSRRNKGTGLGLPLAKALTEMHGGYLIIHSRRGAGTCASVTLPRKRLVARRQKAELAVALRSAS